jgi:hypothetical protein
MDRDRITSVAYSSRGGAEAHAERRANMIGVGRERVMVASALLVSALVKIYAGVQEWGPHHGQQRSRVRSTRI